jgi:hypothetical protein
MLADVDALERACPYVLHEQPLGPYAAYYWSNVNVMSISEIAARLPTIGCDVVTRLPMPTPQTYVIKRAKNSFVVTTRGTTVPKDVLTDVTTELPAGAILKAANSAVAAMARHPTETIAMATHDKATSIMHKAADDVESGRVKVHAGFLVCAMKVFARLVAELSREGAFEPGPALREDTRVIFYGHSLGAACASYMYTWLRDMIPAPQRNQVSCAVMSCPRVVDRQGYASWFERHDLDTYCHYFTHGDAVVHALPGYAGLTHHPSRTYYAADMVPVRRGWGILKPVLAHFVFDTSSFKRMSVSGDGHDWGSTTSQSDIKIHPCSTHAGVVLVAARYRQALAVNARHKQHRVTAAPRPMYVQSERQYSRVMSRATSSTRAGRL